MYCQEELYEEAAVAAEKWVLAISPLPRAPRGTAALGAPDLLQWHNHAPCVPSAVFSVLGRGLRGAGLRSALSLYADTGAGEACVLSTCITHSSFVLNDGSVLPSSPAGWADEVSAPGGSQVFAPS